MKRRVLRHATRSLRAHDTSRATQPARTRCTAHRAFTLVELLFGLSILAIVIVALIGIYFGQSFLNANARAQLLAMNDATRVMEQIRLQNVNCSFPSTAPPTMVSPVSSWDGWLAAQTPSKSLSSTYSETISVTCQKETGGKTVADYCGPNQVGLGDQWKFQKFTSTTFDPIRVTVAIGYQLQARVVGSGSSGVEFTAGLAASGSQLYGSKPLQEGPDANDNGVIDSQVMLTTLVTCR